MPQTYKRDGLLGTNTILYPNTFATMTPRIEDLRKHYYVPTERVTPECFDSLTHFKPKQTPKPKLTQRYHTSYGKELDKIMTAPRAQHISYSEYEFSIKPLERLEERLKRRKEDARTLHHCQERCSKSDLFGLRRAYTRLEKQIASTEEQIRDMRAVLRDGSTVCWKVCGA